MGAVFDEIAGDIETKSHRPVWMMRQAGRYLPEYRAVRSKFSNFMDFCFHPQAATEVTLQPIARFGFDAAIMFSDILVIPQALGQKVWFVSGEGPKLGPLPSLDDMEKRLESGAVINYLSKVYTAIKMTRAELNQNTDLIGFCGGPWTLITYMIEGGSSSNYHQALDLADKNQQFFDRLMALVEKAVVHHLVAQIKAGANLVQVFDSWAGGIPAHKARQRWSFDPLMKIADEVGKFAPTVLFAKGLAIELAQNKQAAWSQHGGKVAVAIGQDQGFDAVRRHLPDNIATQGNIDPQLMVGDWSLLKQKTGKLLQGMASKNRHVINLGHGITPNAKVDNVQRWVEYIQEYPR